MDADVTISSGFFFCCSAAAATATMTADAAGMAAKASSGSYSCSAAAAAATDSAKIRQRGGFTLPLSHKPIFVIRIFPSASPATSGGS